MATIDYTDKIDNHEPPEGLVTAADMNEIKDVVNANAGELNPTDTITTVKSISDLQSISNLEIGQTVETLSYHDGLGVGGGLFNVISEDVGFNLNFEEGAEQGVSQSGLSIGMETADIFEIRFKLESLTRTAETDLVNLGGLNLRVTVNSNLANVGHDYAVTDFATYGTIMYILDDNGFTIDRKDLDFGTWYTVGKSPATSANITSVSIAKMFSYASTMDVSNFSIGSEDWAVNEGSGVVVVGNLGTSLALVNNPTWNRNDYDNGFNFIQTNDFRLLQKVIPNNTVSFYDFGAINNSNVDVYTNDSTEAIQAAYDSPYRVNQGGGNFLISANLYLNKAKDIILSSPFIASDDSLAEDRSNDYFKNDHTTVLYSDGTNANLDFVVYNTTGVNYQNGLVYVGNMTDYIGRAYRVEMTGQIWSGSMLNIGILGNRDSLLTTGIGAIGLEISKTGTEYGFATDMKFSGVFKYCAIGVYTYGFGEDNTNEGIWGNTYDFDIHMKGCKKFYNVQGGDFISIKGMLQDSNVMNDTEKDFWGLEIIPRTAFIDVWTYDRYITTDPAGTYRHEFNYIKADGIDVVLGWRTQRSVSAISAINENKNFRLSDPYKFAVSSKSNLIISDLNNQARFNGDIRFVSYRPYDAVTDSWFEANLYAADDVLNPTTLIQDPSACVITETNDGLLTTTGESNLQYHSVKTEFGFAEISVPFVRSEKLIRIGIAINDNEGIDRFYPTKIQLIVYNATNRYSIILDSNKLSRNFYDLFNTTDSTILNTVFDGMIIRVIGSTDFTKELYITDIAVTTQYQQNKPVLHIGGGQNIYGDLNFSDTTTGVILKDRTLATEYRLVVDNGVLSVESVI